jgi:hypothetical protein
LPVIAEKATMNVFKRPLALALSKSEQVNRRVWKTTTFTSACA